jgi:mono/diheme cytochrome c family protein
MKRSVLCIFLLSTAGFAGDASTPQTQRGRELFLNSPKGLPCATCHSLEGRGNSIGPDLTRLAGVVGPRGLVMTIRMSMTAYVQQVTAQGRTFPGIQKQKEGDTLEIFDLSRTPAVLLTLKSSEVTSMKPNTKWTHPPTSAGYTDEELADLIGYLKFAATGVTSEVLVKDLH